MKLQIKKTIETEDFIEVETPSFWHYKLLNKYYMIKEDELITISKYQITVIENDNGNWFNESVNKAIESERITEVIFLEKLFDVQDSINQKVGVSPIPTIFTQNKFSSFQKETL